MLKLPLGRAICYSGYRDGQSPGERIFPSESEILEDLRMLEPHWRLLSTAEISEGRPARRATVCVRDSSHLV